MCYMLQCATREYIHTKEMVLAREHTALLEAACTMEVCQLISKAASKSDIIDAGEENTPQILSNLNEKFTWSKNAQREHSLHSLGSDV